MGDIELDAGLDFTTSRAAGLGARFNLKFTLGKWRVRVLKHLGRVQHHFTAEI